MILLWSAIYVLFNNLFRYIRITQKFSTPSVLVGGDTIVDIVGGAISYGDVRAIPGTKIVCGSTAHRIMSSIIGGISPSILNGDVTKFWIFDCNSIVLGGIISGDGKVAAILFVIPKLKGIT